MQIPLGPFRCCSVALLTMLTIVLAACGSDSAPDAGERIVVPTPVPGAAFASAHLDADGDGFFVYAELEQAVESTVSSYDWPEAHQPTASDILERFTGGSSMDGHGFGIGLEHKLISSWHQCAWYRSWLDAVKASDTFTQAMALAVMTEVVPFSPVNSSSAQEFELNIARQAALGDPSLVQRHVDLSCGMTFPPHASP